MKIAYLLHWNDGMGSGVMKKVATQTETWVKFGHEVNLFLYSSKTREELEIPSDFEFSAWNVYTYHGMLSRIHLLSKIIRDITKSNPNIVYFRYDLFYPGMNKLLRNQSVIVEVNTNDVTEFYSGGFARYIYNRMTRRLIFSHSYGIVFVSHEIAKGKHFRKFGKVQHVVIGNGIALERITALNPVKNVYPHLAFLGTANQRWHGVDKIEKMASRLPDWNFHLVGISEQHFTTPILPNMHTYGYLNEEQYVDILARCDVAIGSLSMYRVGLGEGSPLKVREYLAYGLPVIIGYSDTDFLFDVPFLLGLPNTPDNVTENILNIESFVQSWLGKRVPREAIAHLDARRKEELRLDFFKRILQYYGR